MQRWMVLFLALGAVQGATIRGVVLDHQTGRPLARANVILEIVQGAGAGRVAVRTGMAGQFEFPPLVAGIYLVSASRPGFATGKFGQKSWNAAATPVILAQDGDQFVDIRLSRMGAVSGAVWDENEIGIPNVDVIAYAATSPPHPVSRGKTDDRGEYRIAGLDPGTYFIRTAAGELDPASGLLPTFFQDVLPLNQTSPVEVSLDQTVSDINIRPVFGRLFQLTGRAYAPPSAGPVKLVLVSDTGQQTATADATGHFSFDQLAPGEYEVYAGTREGAGAWSGYERLSLERDTQTGIHLSPNARLQVTYADRDGGRVDPGSVSVLVRRKTLAGLGEIQKLPSDRVELAAGIYQVMVQPPLDYYAASIEASGRSGMEKGSPNGWNEIRAGGGTAVLMVALSSHPASLRGSVVRSVANPAVAAPVYLEPWDPETGKRLADARGTRTNGHGTYRFTGLAPGTYRVVSTFEFENPDERAFEAAHPVTVKLAEGAEATQDLDLWVER